MKNMKRICLNTRVVKYSIFILITTIAIMLSCTIENCETINAYLYAVSDTNPNQDKHIQTNERTVRFDFYLKNTTRDTLYIPIGKYPDGDVFKSKIVVEHKGKPYNAKLSFFAGSIFGCVIPPNAERVLIIDMPREILNDNKPISAKRLVDTNTISYIYNNEDISEYKVPNIMFHLKNIETLKKENNNNLQKDRMYRIEYDTIRNIKYYFPNEGKSLILLTPQIHHNE